MSFFDDLVEIGLDTVKNGALGYDNPDELKRKIKSKWLGYGGQKEKSVKDCKGRFFFFYWRLNFEDSGDRCFPTAEQVEEALPDELKAYNSPYDKIQVEVDKSKTPMDYVVYYNYRSRINGALEEEAKKRNRDEEDEKDEQKKQKGEEKQEEEDPTILRPYHWGYVSSETCEKSIEETPATCLMLLENALANLGYNVETVTDSPSLAAAWKRALLNEENNAANKALKKALADVVRTCPDKVPLMVDKDEEAKVAAAARRGAS